MFGGGALCVQRKRCSGPVNRFIAMVAAKYMKLVQVRSVLLVSRHVVRVRQVAKWSSSTCCPVQINEGRASVRAGLRVVLEGVFGSDCIIVGSSNIGV